MRFTITPRRHPRISDVQLMDFYSKRPRICGRPLLFGKRLELSAEEVLGERAHIRTLVRNGLILLLDESGTPCPEFLELAEYDPMQAPPVPEPVRPSIEEPAPEPERRPVVTEERVPAELEALPAPLGLPAPGEVPVGEEHDEFLERILPAHVERHAPRTERKPRKRRADNNESGE